VLYIFSIQFTGFSNNLEIASVSIRDNSLAWLAINGTKILKNAITKAHIRMTVIPALRALGILNFLILILSSKPTSGPPIIARTAAINIYATMEEKYQSTYPRTARTIMISRYLQNEFIEEDFNKG
jgi:hypothetical protein